VELTFRQAKAVRISSLESAHPKRIACRGAF
jgi:hypothetical protein